ncbi:MAG: ISL3 family transposase [Acidimicrobiia bacterium]
MRDIELYRQILGLEVPWFVSRVELKVEEERVEVWVEHDRGERWTCPRCGRELGCRDHAAERTWRHLDTCQFQTFLHARIPRVDCPEHGVVQVGVPWAEAGSRFTLLMERLVIDVLQQCTTVQGARRILRLSWDQVWGVMSRAVARGQARKKIRVMPLIGVDEKAFRKGHRYMTVVCDLEQASVEYVAEDRTIESLSGFWRSLTPEQLEGTEAVAMDMWGPYIQSTLAAVPDAARKIVFDRFHIMGHLCKAVDTVRKQEHRALRAVGDETLKGTKYLWLYSEENLPDRLRPTLEALKEHELKVGRAWAIKESLRQLWDYVREGWARRFFRQWFWWATHSRLGPVRKVAHMLRKYLDNIVTYCRHRITNAVAEGLNSKIMSIKRRAGGFRNPENFKTAIYFYCGGLDLYPR